MLSGTANSVLTVNHLAFDIFVCLIFDIWSDSSMVWFLTQLHEMAWMLLLQPPKAKGGKKAGKKGKKKTAKTPVVIDGISTEEMTKEQVGSVIIIQFQSIIM